MSGMIIQQQMAARLSSERHADAHGGSSAGAESSGAGVEGEGYQGKMQILSADINQAFNVNQDLAVGFGGDIGALITSREGVFETNMLDVLDGSFLAPAGLPQAAIPDLQGAGDISVAGAMSQAKTDITQGVGVPGGGQRGG
jgi:hypothetical protein